MGRFAYNSFTNIVTFTVNITFFSDANVIIS